MEEKGRIVKSEVSFFEEEELVSSLIKELCASLARNAREEDVSNRKLVLFKFTECMEKYQEQSLLLDSYLEQMISPIMGKVQEIVREHEEVLSSSKKKLSEASDEALPFQIFRHPHLHLLLQAMYVLCRVRGYKTVVKFLPHEVADLEPTLRLLQSQDASDHETWHIRYILLLWMSILSMIPFDLTTVDSTFCESSPSSMSLIDTVFALCKQYLGDPGPTREAAATCVARLLTRPDLSSEPLAKFLEWATEMLELATDSQKVCSGVVTDDRATDTIQSVFLVTGIYQALVEIFKRGHREKLLPHVPQIFSRVLDLSSRQGFISSLERKLTMKLVQRIGLSFLAPRVVSWRYQRGQRSLLDNFNKALGAEGTSVEPDSAETPMVDDEDDIEIPEEVEDVIEQLLCGLRDKDTIVRWSAAKGVGRITGRLPKEMGDDVVEFVQQLFDAAEGDSAWHGGCLALAELARRGLLLPSRLASVVPLVVKALVYDVRRGHNSVGAHVRDAACYVCWACARAYAPEVMAPHVSDLARQMMVTALFDREVNCRRAAAAAFQENVGRQGHENFPNGITILTAADYFTLGIRANAYKQVAPQVAQFDLYRRSLVEHLVEVKLVHWDKSIRELAAEALGELVQLEPKLFAEDIVVRLLPRGLSPDILVRHGSIKALSSIFKALSRTQMELSEQVLTDARNLVMKLEKARLYRGRGGESIRIAACEFIGAISQAGHSLSERAQLRLLDSIDESLKNAVPGVQESAVSALRSITRDAIEGRCQEAVNWHPFWFSQQRPIASALVERTVSKYCEGLKNENAAIRRGHAMALGVLPARYLGCSEEILEKVVKSLIDACRFNQNESPELRDAQSRMHAVAALGKVVSIVGLQTKLDVPDNFKQSIASLSTNQVDEIMEALLLSMDDYEIDDRGDVGSMVRCQAMRSLVEVTKVLRTFEGRVQTLIELLNSSKSPDNKSPAIGHIGDHSMFFPIVEHNDLGTCFLIRPSTDRTTGWLLSTDITSSAPAKLVAWNMIQFRDPVLSWMGDLANLGEVDGQLETEELTVPPISTRRHYLVENADEKASLSIQNGEPVSELGRYESDNMILLPIGPSMSNRITSGMVKQLGEKLDLVRDTAGHCLSEYLGIGHDKIDIHKLATGLVVEHRKALKIVLGFHEGTTQPTNFKVAGEVFPKLVELLSCERLAHATLFGISLSVGSITESVSKEANKALVSWCKKQKAGEEWMNLNRIAHILVQLLEQYSSEDRVIVPLLKALDVLLEAQVFDYISNSSSWPLRIHGLVAKQIKNTSNVNKVLATIKVFLGLASLFGRPTRTAAYSSLLILLGYKYPKVRKVAAEQFYIWALAMSPHDVCGPPDPNAMKDDWLEREPPQPSDQQLRDIMEAVNEKIKIEKQRMESERKTTVQEPLPYEVTENEIPTDFNQDDAFESVLDILLTSVWDAPTRECRQFREPLYQLLHVRAPKQRSPVNDNVQSATIEKAEDSYASLIHDIKMGY